MEQDSAGNATCADSSAVPAGVRLSPVEQRNLALINDPALEGYRREGRAKSGAAFNAAGLVAADEDDGRTLGRVHEDVIFVGAEIEAITCGPDRPIAHTKVVVDEANERFSTDGAAVYSKDGTKLICLVAERDTYEVQAGCRSIGDRAFDSVSSLERITLPEGIESIGRLAFAKSGISFIQLPSSIKEIGEKALYHCKNLLACLLNDGLESIGDDAFTLSGIERIHIPASVARIGRAAFDRTPAERGVVGGTITIDPKSNFYEIDHAGGIYRTGELAYLLSCVSEYQVMPGCGRISSEACLRNMRLERVSIPESVVEIGDDAFRGCKRLAQVELPKSLERIGARAFMNTRIGSLFISKSVEHIGPSALLVQGENPTRSARLLHHIDLEQDNPQFYIESGLFCERGAGDAGADMALLYVGPDVNVRIPDAVNRLAPYALLGVSDVLTLQVHEHMHSICEGSLAVGRSIPEVRVELPAREGGVRQDVLFVPSLSARFHDMTALFTTNERGTVVMYPYFDAWVTTTSSVDEFAQAALARMRRPYGMDADMQKTYRDLLTRKQTAVCRYFAQVGDLDALEDLVVWKVLEASTVEEELTQAAGSADAAAMGCLLELKRRMGAGAGLDLSI